MSRNGCFELFLIGAIIIFLLQKKLFVDKNWKTFCKAYLATFDVISSCGSIFGHWSKSTDSVWSQWKTIEASLNIFKVFDAFCLIVFNKLRQLWTLYCDQTRSPGESSTHASSIVMEFWGKVTPGILHLLTQAKEVRSSGPAIDTPLCSANIWRL